MLASPPTFWPHEWDLRAYRTLFYETNFWRYFQNTIVVSAITTVIVVTAVADAEHQPGEGQPEHPHLGQPGPQLLVEARVLGHRAAAVLVAVEAALVLRP